jgi:hypothetical protein
VKSGGHPPKLDRKVGLGEVVATRAPEVRLHARNLADNAGRERHGAEEHRSNALPGPHMLEVGARSALRQRTSHLQGCNVTEAGGSPSSEAPPAGSAAQSAEAQVSAGLGW